jgi:hypothetical protein
MPATQLMMASRASFKMPLWLLLLPPAIKQHNTSASNCLSKTVQTHLWHDLLEVPLQAGGLWYAHILPRGYCVPVER